MQSYHFILNVLPFKFDYYRANRLKTQYIYEVYLICFPHSIYIHCSRYLVEKVYTILDGALCVPEDSLLTQNEADIAMSERLQTPKCCHN